MKFTALGDAQLWPVLWQRMPEARYDSFVAAKQVFDYAESQNLPVIASGDIFNFGQKGGVANCLTFLQRQLTKLSEFRFIVGNHDLTGYTSGVINRQWMETFTEEDSHVQHLGLNGTAGAGNLVAAGIDYQHGRTEFLEKLAQVRKHGRPNVLVIHQGLKEILGYEGAWEVECAELEGVADVVICGHTHVCWEKQVGDTLVVSPGSTIPWQFDEEHEKSFPVVSIGEGGKASVTWIPIPIRRPILTAVATNAEERAKVLQVIQEYTADEKLPEEIRQPILRLRYIAEEKFHSQLLEAAEGKMILDLTADRVQLTGRINLGALEDKPQDVDDVVVATHKHTSPGRVRDAAIEIQRTRDPDGVIEKHITELMGVVEESI